MPVELEPRRAGPRRGGSGRATACCGARPVPSRSSLVDAFLARSRGAAAAFVGLSWRELPVPDGLRVVSYGALGGSGGCRRSRSCPCHFSALPRLFAARRLPGDVALIQVAPPDAARPLQRSASASTTWPMRCAHARAVIAEVNERCPATARRVDRVGSARRRRAHLAAAARGAGRASRARPTADRRARRRARRRRRHDPAGRRRAARGDPGRARRPSRPRRALGDDLRRACST